MGTPDKKAGHRRRRTHTRTFRIETLDTRRLLSCTPGPGGGDFNSNRICDASDIESLSQVVRAGVGNSLHDLNLDGHFDQEDRRIWIQNLAGSWYGDVNLDQSFDGNDLQSLQRSTEYADKIARNSTWADGDFTGDSEFDAFDWLASMQAGGYGRGKFSGGAVPLPQPRLQSLAVLKSDGASDLELAYDAATGSLDLRSTQPA